MAKHTVIACAVLLREISLIVAEAENIVDTVFLEQGLHNEPDKLRSELQVAIDRVEAKLSDDDCSNGSAILLGYGLCSNGTVGVKSTKVPLVIPRAHDCITLLLGSKEKYKEYFDTHRGVYWYSAGWIERSLQPGKERYEKTLANYAAKYGDDNAQYLMEMEQGWFKEYEWATFIDWKLPSSDKYRRYTRDCAEYLGWHYDEIRGDSSLIKDWLDGRWDEERFQVVPPGKPVAADHRPEKIVGIG